MNRKSRARIYWSGGSSLPTALVMALAWATPPMEGESLRLDFSLSAAARLKEQAEARKTRLTVRRCDSPAAIDGDLNDGAWKGTVSVNLGGAPPAAARFCFDNSALYIGVVCQETPGYKAQARECPRDTDAWKDDCLELYFLPPSARPVTYQFVLNAANAIYDDRDGVAAYDPQWTHAVKRTENGWTAEMAFPFKALELSGAVNRIGFNMHHVGPNLPIQPLARPERDPSAGCLVLEGVTTTGEQPVEAKVARPASLAVEGSGLVVDAERFETEPGERWLPVGLTLRPKGPLAQSKVEAKLFRLEGTEPVDAVSATPDRVRGTLKVDLVSRKLTAARLSLRLMEGNACTGAAALLLSRKPCPRPLKSGEKIPVLLDFPQGMTSAGRWPVTFGLPFPAGALWEVENGSVPVRLVDKQGAEIPSQAEVVARWAPEGSVKWLRVDALATPDRGCFAEIGASPRTPTVALRLTETGDSVTVDTGVARFVLGKGTSPIREIWQGDRRAAKSDGARGLYLIDQTGRLATASAEEENIVVEARGPVAGCVRFEGWYKASDGQRVARHITRVEAFAGQVFLRVTHTLVLTEDTNKLWFKDLGWELSVAPGASPEALFGLAPPAADFRKTATVPLQGATASAYMLQDSHYRFAHGTNHFSVAAIGADGKEVRKAEGEECGDWSALRGKGGGLLVGCRDAARQHPKEFEVFRDRVVLHLFSNRGGEELDYRTTTLMKHWNLPDWIRLHNRLGGVVGRHDEKELMQRIESYVNDASGGAKTHDLLFATVDPTSQTESLAQLGGLHGASAYALADPRWTYETRVMGPNYPRDVGRFPEAEKAVQAVLQSFLAKDAAWGEHGFIDYFAGPHASLYMEDRVPVLFRYIEFTYYFRAQLWLLYSRSGDRSIRYFAEGTNRAYLDNRFAHWGDRTGYFRLDNGSACNLVPLYWHKSYRMLELGEFLNNFLWDYYLTGDRRMRDGLQEIATVFKAGWSESAVLHDWTKNSILQHCMQLYSFTGDEEFGAMGERTLDLITDPLNGILLTKRAYESSTYKTGQAIRSLATAYWLCPSPRLLDLCTRVGQWLQEYPYSPFGYTPSGSIVAPFLYDLTGDPAQAQGLAIAVRNIGGLCDLKTGQLAPEMQVRDFAPGTPFLFDIGYALHPIVSEGLDKGVNAASWLCYTDDLGGARPILRKKTDEVVRLRYQAGATPTIRMLDTPVNQVSQGDAGVISLRQDDALSPKGDLLLPKDAPAGDYIIQFPSRGPASLFASSKAKMVLYAPDYWMPMLPTGGSGEAPDRQQPPFRFYFDLPKDAPGAAIFFGAESRLYDPDGKPWPPGRGEEPMRGWVDLPAGKPGLWSFAALRQGMVRTRNLPPFFAFNDPQAYFESAVLDWKSEAQAEEPPLRADSLYVPGPSHREDDRALYLSGRKYFKLDPPKTGDAGFIPNREGTLEFFLRPNWDFFDLKASDSRGLVWGGGGLYAAQGASGIVFNWDMDGKIPKVPFAGCRNGPSMLLKDRWTHVAIVWGPSPTVEVIWGQYGAKSITSQTRQKRMNLTIYINGKKSPQSYNNHPVPADGEFFLPMSTLAIGGLAETNRIDAAIDNLRLSDIQRYTEDFSPPPRECEFTVDPYTRALFLFDGNLEGRGRDLKDPLIGVLKED